MAKRPIRAAVRKTSQPRRAAGKQKQKAAVRGKSNTRPRRGAGSQYKTWTFPNPDDSGPKALVITIRGITRDRPALADNHHRHVRTVWTVSEITNLGLQAEKVSRLIKLLGYGDRSAPIGLIHELVAVEQKRDPNRVRTNSTIQEVRSEADNQPRDRVIIKSAEPVTRFEHVLNGKGDDSLKTAFQSVLSAIDAAIRSLGLERIYTAPLPIAPEDIDGFCDKAILNAVSAIPSAAWLQESAAILKCALANQGEFQPAEKEEWIAVTPKKLASMLGGLHRNTIYNYLKTGTIRNEKISATRSYRVAKRDVDRLAARRSL